MHHRASSWLVVGLLALPASSCRGNSEAISQEPVSRSNTVVQTLYIDSATLDWKRLYRSTVMPEQDQGRVLGVRFFIHGVDAGSDGSDGSGLRTLDRIEAIDGVPARTATSVVDAFARVRQMHEVRFDVRRRGHLLRLVYVPAR